MELKGRYNRSQEHLVSGFPVSGDHQVQDSVMGKQMGANDRTQLVGS